MWICSFLLKHKGLALPALKICLEAFSWTDSESLMKVSSFCATVVLLSILTNNVELREFVCRDLFSAAIQGLALEANTFTSAELVGLCREIYMYLCDRDPTPRQVRASQSYYFNIQSIFKFFHEVLQTQYIGIQKLMRKYFLGSFQILLSLPCITPNDLAAFEEALMKTASPKEQKQHMKSLLILATGNKLKALAAQKSVNVITNVSG